jgi:hypothetical protein
MPQPQIAPQAPRQVCGRILAGFIAHGGGGVRALAIYSPTYLAFVTGVFGRPKVSVASATKPR